VPRFVSGNFEELTGFTLDDVRRAPDLWAERVHPEDRERVLTGLAERQQGRSMAVEYRWQCADGRYKYFLDQAVLLRDATGEPIEYAGTLLDVSDQRELEQQLVQSRKSEALGQLTGGVAHDFNNLLAAVLGGLRLIEGRVELGPREKQIFDQMRNAAEKGAELVRRLMAFARKQELTPSCIEPRTLRDSVAGLVDHALGDDVTIDWRLADEGLRLYADEAQLELALVNLLINARDAMPDGGTIAVAIEPAKAPENAGSSDEWLRIRVRDEGCGISPELIERVTEPFFTTKAVGKGTGLGLSMVAGFVEQSGGVFRIDSDLGRGTQIDMILPATRAEGEAAATAAPQEDPKRLVGSVLLVDDDASVRLILSEHLRDLGLKVSVAEDAAHALRLLESNGHTPDFVLTDLSMPGMDGFNLLGAIGERWPKIRGAVMTGNPQERVARCDPQFSVIHKPIEFGELKRLLASA
jgi:PAS domain S-box-containing protein